MPIAVIDGRGTFNADEIARTLITEKKLTDWIRRVA